MLHLKKTGQDTTSKWGVNVALLVAMVLAGGWVVVGGGANIIQQPVVEPHV